MSVRAYKIITKQVDDNPSFNLWHDKKLMEYLDNECDVYQHLSSDGDGTIEIPTTTLKKLLTKKLIKELELDEYHIEAIKSDITMAKKNKDDYVIYECY
jgi:hypothetical protein